MYSTSSFHAMNIRVFTVYNVNANEDTCPCESIDSAKNATVDEKLRTTGNNRHSIAASMGEPEPVKEGALRYSFPGTESSKARESDKQSTDRDRIASRDHIAQWSSATGVLRFRNWIRKWRNHKAFTK